MIPHLWLLIFFVFGMECLSDERHILQELLVHRHPLLLRLSRTGAPLITLVEEPFPAARLSSISKKI